MSGCNCKSKNEVNVPFVNNTSEKNNNNNLVIDISIYMVKLFGFFIGLLLLPIIIGAVIIFMFRIIVLTKEVDIKPLFNSIFKLLNTASDKDEFDEEDIDNDNETEYVMLNVEDITKK